MPPEMEEVLCDAQAVEAMPPPSPRRSTRLSAPPLGTCRPITGTITMYSAVMNPALPEVVVSSPFC
jgi:hypothetical protein